MPRRRNKTEDETPPEVVEEPRLEERPMEEPMMEDEPPPPLLPDVPEENKFPESAPPNGATERQLPKVRLRQFLAMSGKKFDQLAGFKWYAERYLKGAAMTIPEWKEAFQNFHDRPTGLKR